MNRDRPFDLDAYCKRIGLAAPVAPTLATLRQIQRLHPQAIPFENLDPLMGRPVKLDLDSLQAKLIRSRRGGYCFEHNLLLARALAEIGFDVSGLSARVLWGQSEEAITARSHMLLRVVLPDGVFIADVGFGGQTPTAPLRLIADEEQQTPLGLFRLAKLDDGFKLQSKIGADWMTLYRFDLQRQHPIDYEAANFYVSTNPLSHFTQRLSAARPVAEGRYALLNNTLHFHRAGQPSESRVLDRPAAIRETLDRTFGIDVPDVPGFEAAMARLGLFEAL